MSARSDSDVKSDAKPFDSDVESGPKPEIKTEGPAPKPQDPNLVTWDGPKDPENPKNWPDAKKWRYTVTVSVFCFISPISSSMVAPALQQLGRDLGTTSDLEVELALSIFLLAYAIGPIFFGPMSELHGRVRILQLSNLWYLAWNLGCGFAQNKAEFFVFRFLAGLGGSAPLAIGGGALSDVWMPHNKGKAMAIYTLSPILGPVIGPIAGGFIAERSTWRWVFWSTSAFALFIQCIGLWGLTESHAPTLLRRKRERLVKETGNTALHTGEGPPMSLPKRLADAFTRPLKMFATQPIVMLISVYIAYIFGLNYLLFVIFPGVYTGVYGEPIGIAGLHYAALGIGLIIGLFVQFFFIDKVYMRLKKRNNNVGRPEFRIPTMVIGSVLVTAGLFWYGWSVQLRNHWVVPDLGIIVFSAGTMICLNGMQTYIIETYMKYAASAMAASAILRSLCGFSFPLFAPYLYNALGYGWGTSVLAFISIAIGWTAPFIFWFYGPKLRAVSKFASG